MREVASLRHAAAYWGSAPFSFHSRIGPTPLARGCGGVVMDDFREIRVIGQGAFGRAVLVEKVAGDMVGEKFVIKQINLSVMGDQARKDAEQEVKVRAANTARLVAAATSLCFSQLWWWLSVTGGCRGWPVRRR